MFFHIHMGKHLRVVKHVRYVCQMAVGHEIDWPQMAVGREFRDIDVGWGQSIIRYKSNLKFF